MAIDTASPRSRRALLAAAVGAVGATIASALGRPLPARAGVDGDVVLGSDQNVSAATTKITVGTPGYSAFWGNATGTGLSVGVRGDTASSYYSASGLWGNASANGAGVRGTSTDGLGVHGIGGSIGVYGEGPAAGVDGFSETGDGVHGHTESATGVRGFSRYGDAIVGTSETGVALYGESGSGRGVWGQSTANRGVQGNSGSAFGVYGRSESSDGVHGTGPSSVGVRGESSSGTGMLGSSLTGSGVGGWSQAADRAAMYGHSRGDATGLLAFSGPVAAALPAAKPKTGLYAEATQDTASRGVWGRSAAGRGVFGEATSGVGLYGQATTGYALRTSGRVKVDKASGVATIAATKTSVVVTPGLGVTSASFVLLTPRGNLGGRSLWYTVSTTAGTITIRVSSAVTADLKVGWLLLG